MPSCPFWSAIVHARPLGRLERPLPQFIPPGRGAGLAVPSWLRARGASCAPPAGTFAALQALPSSLLPTPYLLPPACDSRSSRPPPFLSITKFVSKQASLPPASRVNDNNSHHFITAYCVSGSRFPPLHIPSPTPPRQTDPQNLFSPHYIGEGAAMGAESCDTLGLTQLIIILASF